MRAKAHQARREANGLPPHEPLRGMAAGVRHHLADAVFAFEGGDRDAALSAINEAAKLLSGMSGYVGRTC